MEPAAAPAEDWGAPLGDLALVIGLPVLLVLAVSAGWAGGSVIGAIGVSMVLVIGRGEYGPLRTGLVTTVSAFYLIACGFLAWLALAVSCQQPTHPWIAQVAGLGVFAAIAGVSLRKRLLWGIPLAILLGFVVFATVYAKLPGPPIYCSD